MEELGISNDLTFADMHDKKGGEERNFEKMQILSCICVPFQRSMFRFSDAFQAEVLDEWEATFKLELSFVMRLKIFQTLSIHSKGWVSKSQVSHCLTWGICHRLLLSVQRWKERIFGQFPTIFCPQDDIAVSIRATPPLHHLSFNQVSHTYMYSIMDYLAKKYTKFVEVRMKRTSCFSSSGLLKQG